MAPSPVARGEFVNSLGACVVSFHTGSETRAIALAGWRAGGLATRLLKFQ